VAPLSRGLVAHGEGPLLVGADHLPHLALHHVPRRRHGFSCLHITWDGIPAGQFLLTEPVDFLPWGVVSLIDVYEGFALFLGWVAYREASIARTVVWVLRVFTFANAIASGCMLLALARRRNDWCRF